MTALDHFSNALRYRDESHPDQTQFTPSYVLSAVRSMLSGVIGLDPCTTPDNPCGALRWFAPPVDGAALPWDSASIFVNPPYGKARERWVERCIEAGRDRKAVVLLIPAATDTRTFQHALATSSGCVLIRGRVKFGVLRPNRRQMAASHPSALIGWNVEMAYGAYLGLMVTPRRAPAWALK